MFGLQIETEHMHFIRQNILTIPQQNGGKQRGNQERNQYRKSVTKKLEAKGYINENLSLTTRIFSKRISLGKLNEPNKNRKENLKHELERSNPYLKCVHFLPLQVVCPSTFQTHGIQHKDYNIPNYTTNPSFSFRPPYQPKNQAPSFGLCDLLGSEIFN